MSEVESKPLGKQTLYWIHYRLLQITGGMAIAMSLVSDELGRVLVGPSVFLCCVTTVITILVLFCKLWRICSRSKHCVAQAEESETVYASTTFHSFCYKWCSRLLVIIGACCVVITILSVVCLLAAASGIISLFGDEHCLLVSVWILSFNFMHYFCLFAAVPVLFTAVLKLLDRH